MEKKILATAMLFACASLYPVSNTPPSGSFRGCPAEGDGADTQLNVLKNRAEQASSPKQMTVADVQTLPSPPGVEKTPRSQWPANALAVVAEHVKLYQLKVISWLLSKRDWNRPTAMIRPC